MFYPSQNPGLESSAMKARHQHAAILGMESGIMRITSFGAQDHVQKQRKDQQELFRVPGPGHNTVACFFRDNVMIGEDPGEKPL